MAVNTPTGDKARKGAMKKRSQRKCRFTIIPASSPES
jgi:hypothetical protein